MALQEMVCKSLWGKGENTECLHLFVLFLFFDSKGKWIRTKVMYSTPSFNYILIRYKRTSFLSAIVNVYGPRHGICILCLWFGYSVLTYLPPVQLGLPFQATVKPAGDHLCAICWNEIYILGLDYLVALRQLCGWSPIRPARTASVSPDYLQASL